MKGVKRKVNNTAGRGIILRRMSQIIFFLVFLVLFLKTDYTGSDQLSGAVNLLFRLDPFLAACVMLGMQAVIVVMLPALAVLLISLFFGRGFCGWFCPMGTLLDFFSKILPNKGKKIATYFPNFPLYLLIFSIIGSVFGIAFSGFVDPFSILVRGMAQAIYPAFNTLTVNFFTFTYQEMPGFVNWVTEPVYDILKHWVLPSQQKYFHLAYLSLLTLVVVFLLEGIQRRFFCRNICPLGAMLSLVAQRGSMVGVGGSEACGVCQICHKSCRIGAIDSDRTIDMAACNLCLECVVKCPREIISFSFGRQKRTSGVVSFSRRRFLGAALTGMMLPSVKKIEPIILNPEPQLIRPPGAITEKDFLQRCVRCAECVQVCIGNALQPAFLQAGFDGMFSPMLVARTGYCEFNCTLCGQVCPTGAIRELTQKDKWQVKIGHAWFDKNSCLPYAKGIPCMVCEEHCPTSEKAIRFRLVQMIGSENQPVTVKQPYIVDELCIGCGICEFKCPIPGKSAIYLTSAGEHRNPEAALPVAKVGLYGS